MTLKPNHFPLYSDLVQETEDNIVALCQNVGHYSNSVPDAIKPGFVGTVYCPREGEPGNNAYPSGYWRYDWGHHYTLNATDKLNVVTEQQIRQDFRDFLTARGISTKQDRPMTSKGILNFYNNVSAFCSVRIIAVSSQFTEGKVLFYDQSDVTYPTVPVVDDYDAITAEDIEAILTNLNQTMNRVSKMYVAKYTMSAFSSCSSSSSSSSSSAYIAFFSLR